MASPQHGLARQAVPSRAGTAGWADLRAMSFVTLCPGELRRPLRRPAGLRGRLHLLLVRPDLGQRVVVHDVGYRVVGAFLTEMAGGLAPAVGPHAEVLAEQRREDLGLGRAEPGEFPDPPEQFLTGGRAVPDLRRIAVVALDDD